MHLNERKDDNIWRRHVGVVIPLFGPQNFKYLTTQTKKWNFLGTV